MSVATIAPRTQIFEAEALPHLPALYRVAVRMTHDQSTAEDLVQETLERAYRSFDRYKPGTNIRAWLFKIMSYTSISKYRSASRGPTTSLDEMSEFNMYREAINAGIDPADVEETVLSNIGEQRIMEAIAALQPDYRLAVLLTDVEQYSYRETAEILGIPIGTVMSRLHRGRKILQRLLWEYASAAGYTRCRATAAG